MYLFPGPQSHPCGTLSDSRACTACPPQVGPLVPAAKPAVRLFFQCPQDPNFPALFQLFLGFLQTSLPTHPPKNFDGETFYNAKGAASAVQWGTGAGAGQEQGLHILPTPSPLCSLPLTPSPPSLMGIAGNFSFPRNGVSQA